MKALFIGLGSIGQRHLRNLRRLIPDIEVHALRRSRSTPLLDDLNQVIGSRSQLCNTYRLIEHSSLEDALNLEPELAFVTGPSSQHSKDAKDLLLKSSSSIFVEKPISHNCLELHELINIEKQGRQRIMVGFQYRFSPLLQHVKQLLEASDIGNIISASFVNSEYMPGWHPYEDYRNSYAARTDLGGGALLTQIHDFDYATWLLGMPGSLYAVGGKLSNLDINVEDSVDVLMKCFAPDSEQPIPVSIKLDYLGKPPTKSFRIVGDEGQITGDLLTGVLELYKHSCSEKTIFDYSTTTRNDMFIDQLKAFLAFHSVVICPPVGLQEAELSLRLALLSKESMHTNQVLSVQ